ncbi:hypothetical protein RU86_GL000549 [Lactococcus piscium]|uniref:Uncharacterized protein n=1 Tax=Pseudolactococcus piscium TaxID=1364 RepID=A0A2A5RX69_9LACT|nr:hypothetical protein [Lactococcus piscium]PCS05794.1 hypothetical protein RU86_GL000549 [Lactococcus piscium]
MQSVSVYGVNGSLAFDNSKIDDFTKKEEKVVSGHTEELSFQLFKNEMIGTYTRCRIVMDEVFSLRARVFGQDTTEVIVNVEYDILIANETGKLIILANKKSCDKISEYISEEFGVNYQKIAYNLPRIIEDSTDVKKAQFRKVRIETIHGSSISGTRVTDTNVFKDFDGAGELSNIAVVYSVNGEEVSFSISDIGSIVIFSTITEMQIIIDLIYLLSD